MRYCEDCQTVAKKLKKELNCDSCSNRSPELDSDLVSIFNCFVLSETQLLVGGMGTIYGLNYSVVFEIAKAMGITINTTFLRLLKAFETTLVSEIQKKAEQKTISNKETAIGR